MTALTIRWGGQSYPVTLSDTPLAAQIAAACPLDLAFTRRAGHEYYSRLDAPLSQTGSTMTSHVQRGEITYFESWNALSLSFAEAVIAPFSVAHLGWMDEALAARLADADGELLLRLEAHDAR